MGTYHHGHRPPPNLAKFGLRQATRLERAPWTACSMLTALNSVESMIHGSALFAVLWAITTVVVAARVLVAPAHEVESSVGEL